MDLTRWRAEAAAFLRTAPGLFGGDRVRARNARRSRRLANFWLAAVVGQQLTPECDLENLTC